MHDYLANRFYESINKLITKLSMPKSAWRKQQFILEIMQKQTQKY